MESRAFHRFVVPCALVVSILSGCGLFAKAAALPFDPSFRPPGDCVGVGLDAILHGDAADPRVTWMVDRSSGRRIDVVWPVGYGARFAPSLEVLDEAGMVIAREGDLIIGGCPTALLPEGVVWIGAADVRPADWEPGQEDQS